MSQYFTHQILVEYSLCTRIKDLNAIYKENYCYIMCLLEHYLLRNRKKTGNHSLQKTYLQVTSSDTFSILY